MTAVVGGSDAMGATGCAAVAGAPIIGWARAFAIAGGEIRGGDGIDPLAGGTAGPVIHALEAIAGGVAGLFAKTSSGGGFDDTEGAVGTVAPVAA